MSKPDSTGESLESILASIRRSLAEQSTDLLEDESGPATLLPPDEGTADDADVPRLFGGSGAATVAAPAAEHEIRSRLDDDPPPPASTLAAPVQEAPLAAPPAPAPASPNDFPSQTPATVPLPPQPAQKDAARDPFWFLSGRGEAGRKDGAGTAADAPRPAASSAPKVPVPEPKPARSEIVRGPLPPFFGSSAEAAKIEVAPGPAAAPAPSAVPPPGPVPGPALAARAPAGNPPRGVPAEAPRAPAWPPAPSSAPPASTLPPLFTAQPAASPVPPPAARESLANGKGAFFTPPQPTGAAIPAATGADALPHVRGLEAMVAELLRPMLRRWLDENMPRLVSAALKAEADVMSGRDPKKP